jgi:hypothetical protein
MSNNVDPLLQEEALTKLQNLKLKAELDELGKTLSTVFSIKVPEFEEITTKEELQTLIAAIEAGTADNNRLARFIDIANRLLGRI